MTQTEYDYQRSVIRKNWILAKAQIQSDTDNYRNMIEQRINEEEDKHICKVNEMNEKRGKLHIEYLNLIRDGYSKESNAVIDNRVEINNLEEQFRQIKMAYGATIRDLRRDAHLHRRQNEAKSRDAEVEMCRQCAALAKEYHNSQN